MVDAGSEHEGKTKEDEGSDDVLDISSTSSPVRINRFVSTVSATEEKNYQKKNLGQFYTTNYNYILQNLYIPKNIKTIIEPFVGNRDLLKFIEKADSDYNSIYRGVSKEDEGSDDVGSPSDAGSPSVRPELDESNSTRSDRTDATNNIKDLDLLTHLDTSSCNPICNSMSSTSFKSAAKSDLLIDRNIVCYDIDPKDKNTIKQDTILNPPIYNNSFILTNPPYLARNKSNNKEKFNKYNVNDLYKCFIKELITNIPIGGILIIPLNFWCSIRKSDIKLRKDFLKKFKILHLNIFEERVFKDTSYTICSFQFEKKKSQNVGSDDVLDKSRTCNRINIKIYPSPCIDLVIYLSEINNYIIGGEIYNLPQNDDILVGRLTKLNKDVAEERITNILVKCIDDNSNNKISLKYVCDNERYIDNTDKLSCRTYATLIIEPILTIIEQKNLITNFNKYLNAHRKKFHSLFLTNYRESKNIARKRISFKLVYKIVNYLLNEINHL